MKRVLLLCTGNSARSQMSDDWIKHFGALKVEAFSAGPHPAPMVNPFAVEVMKAKDIPLSRRRSRV